MPLLLAAPRTAASLLLQSETSCSGRACGVPAPLGARPLAARPLQHPQPARRLVVRRAEFSRDPRGGGGGSGGASGSGSSGPPTQQQQQQPWGADSYQYAPPPSSTPPPRLPPTNGGGAGGGEGPGGGGLSNLMKAFIAGSFILGMGAGIWFTSEVTFEPQNLASTQMIDTKTPNSEVSGGGVAASGCEGSCLGWW